MRNQNGPAIFPEVHHFGPLASLDEVVEGPRFLGSLEAAGLTHESFIYSHIGGPRRCSTTSPLPVGPSPSSESSPEAMPPSLPAEAGQHDPYETLTPDGGPYTDPGGKIGDSSYRARRGGCASMSAASGTASYRLGGDWNLPNAHGIRLVRTLRGGS